MCAVIGSEDKPLTRYVGRRQCAATSPIRHDSAQLWVGPVGPACARALRVIKRAVEPTSPSHSAASAGIDESSTAGTNLFGPSSPWRAELHSIDRVRSTAAHWLS